MEENKQCCTPGPLAKEHDKVGTEEEWCGVNSYLNWPTGATQAVVLISDVFGWKKPLLRRIADKIAAAGIVAVVPDFFRGDCLDASKYVLPNGYNFKEWLANHPYEGSVEDTLVVVKGLKDKGISSVGTAGFCYGAKVGILVAKEGVVDATVFLHPSLVIVDDLKVMKAPLAILAAEIDRTTPVEVVEQYRQYLESQNELEYLVKIFPGVEHGWTVRYEENDEKAVKSANEAHSDAISWFKKYLK